MADTTSPVEIRVRLFGSFRRWSPGGEIRLSAPPGTRLSTVRALLEGALERQHPGFDGHALLAASALADDASLLGDEWSVPPGGGVELAVLPPVCGG
jgi:molybdopterin converting factor small subunit